MSTLPYEIAQRDRHGELKAARVVDGSDHDAALKWALSLAATAAGGSVTVQRGGVRIAYFEAVS